MSLLLPPQYTHFDTESYFELALANTELMFLKNDLALNSSAM